MNYCNKNRTALIHDDDPHSRTCDQNLCISMYLVYTGRMLLLMPNQQQHIIEGITATINRYW